MTEQQDMNKTYSSAVQGYPMQYVINPAQNLSMQGAMPGMAPPMQYGWPYAIPQQQMADWHRKQAEEVDNKEFQEIYEHVKEKQKRKYMDKIKNLKKQIKEANINAELARAKPKQRTVKVQTKTQTVLVNRGCNPIKLEEQDDKEISAQPSFRQESLEKAVSEKLDEIQNRARDESMKKKNYQRISYRPPGKFSQVQKPMYTPMNDISNKYRRFPGHVKRSKVGYHRPQNYTPQDRRPDLKRKSKPHQPQIYEREKRVDSLSHNEINSAVKTLLY